ncbi:ITFG2 protein, partial [Polyodon spathula]|nr:ITFG2 protein [Polyodon spathula]
MRRNWAWWRLLLLSKDTISVAVSQDRRLVHHGGRRIILNCSTDTVSGSSGKLKLLRMIKTFLGLQMGKEVTVKCVVVCPNGLTETLLCVGQYTCKDGRNSPCLVYVSFNHKIYVYWRVELERMESTNLLKVLEEKEEYRELLGKLHIDADDNTAVRDLIHNLLYENKKNTISA